MKLSKEDLFDLAKDRPNLTNEIFTQNDFYGHASVLKQYARLSQNYQIKASIEHGIGLGPAVWHVDSNAINPAMIVLAKSRYPFVKAVTNKAVFSIGPILAYSPDFLDEELYKNEKKRLGKNLLVFPAHSTHWIDCNYDIKEFCDFLKEFGKKFDSIRICLFWKEILRGYSEIYLKQGFECVTAGHMYDNLFLPRLKSIIKLADFTMSNQVGTYIGYCIFMGKPHYLVKTEITLSSEQKECLDLVANMKTPDVQEIEEAFSIFSNEITPEQKEVTEKFWGISEIKTVEEMQLIFNITEDIYKKGPALYMSGKDVLKEQALEYLDLKENNKSLFLINQSMEVNPENKFLNYGKSILLARSGFIKEAIGTLEELLTIMPEHKKARMLRDELITSSMFMKQTSENSIKIFEENSQMSVHKMIEDAYKSLYEHDHNLAFNILIKAKSLKQPHRGLDYLRAICFMKMNQLDAAREVIREELRYFPDNLEARKLLDQILIQIPETISGKVGDREFQELLKIIRPYTMLGEERLYSLFSLAKRACLEDIPGNFVECGVAGGGSTALLAAVIKRYSKKMRWHYAFDSYEGMPAPSEYDKLKGLDADLTGWGNGTCAAPEDSVREICTKLEVWDIVKTVKGYFQSTLPKMQSTVGKIALLHMDADWYESMKTILHNCYDNVIDNGFIQVDDYAYWDGCKKAVHEFETLMGLKFNINQIDGNAIWFQKKEYKNRAIDYNIQAEEEFERGNKDEAIAIFLNIIEKWPDDNRALNNLGKIYLELGEAEKSLEYFIKAFRNNPDDRNTVLSLAEMMIRLEKYDSAVKLYSSYLEKHSDDFEMERLLTKLEGNIKKKKYSTKEKNLLQLNPEELEWIGVRFFDPLGRVFKYKDNYYRAIYYKAKDYLDWLFEEGIITGLIRNKFLIETDISDFCVDGYSYVLKHKTQPFIVPVHQWPKRMLRDSALIYLNLNLYLLDYNLGLIDGHTGNMIQIDNAAPVWIDLGSIVRLTEPATGLEEFCQQFIYPLFITSKGANLGRIGRLIIKEGGLNKKEIFELMGLKIEWSGNRKDILTYLRNMVENIEFLRMKTMWSEYHDEEILFNIDNIKSSSELDPHKLHIRSSLINEAIDRFKPEKLVDAGCNAGYYSLIAARKGISVIAFDLDEEAVDRLYNIARTYYRDLNISIAIRDILDTEHDYKGDLALALAVTHHLTLSQKFPFSYVAKILSSYTKYALITEFMPKGLGTGHTGPVPDPLPEFYKIQNFIVELEKYFRKIEIIDYPVPEGVSPRTLIICFDKYK